MNDAEALRAGQGRACPFTTRQPFTHTTRRGVWTTSTRSDCAATTASMPL